MTTEEAEKLIDDMVKENRDSTIKDFQELRKEIEGIETTTKKREEFTENLIKTVLAA